MLTTSNNYRNKQGFALIVTIVLVAFLVLLLIGLATFTRVETQVANSGESISKARQNALLSINLAIGELQRYAGPDQAVTARAQIDSTSPHPFLTGVWDTSAGAGGGLNGNSADTWLVSRDPAAAADSLAGVLTPSNAEDATAWFDDTNAEGGWVYLVQEEAVGAAANAKIKLAKQLIQVPESSIPGLGSGVAGVTIGHYAYWVADEGVKASIALNGSIIPSALDYNGLPHGDNWSPANTQRDFTFDRLRQFGVVRPNLSREFTGIDYSAGTVLAQIPNMLTLEQLQLITGGPNATQRRAAFHDFTPLSKGVLADTNAGTTATARRLREDLSESVTGAAAINVYWKSRPSNSPNIAGATYDLTARDTTAILGSNLQHGVFPVLSEAGVYLGATGGSGAAVNLTVMAVAELWNPYAATLVSSSAQNLRITFRTTAGFDVRVVDDSANEHTFNVPAGTVLAQYSLDSAGITWTPGQVKQLESNGIVFIDGGGSPVNFLAPGPSLAGVLDDINLTADIPSGDITVDLEFGSVAPFSPLQTFAIQGVRNTTPADVSPGLGLGYEFVRDLSYWTDPRRAASRDPRSSTINLSVDFEPDATSHWREAPGASVDAAGLGGGGDLFKDNVVILFDLPRQEITSVAQLRHMIGAVPYSLGGSTLIADNRLLDIGFASTIPRAPVAWDWTLQGRPNRYLEVYVPTNPANSEWDSAANQLASLRSVNSARFQLLKGAFNINSTSVNAWEAVLGTALQVWPNAGNPSTVLGIADNLENPFFRVPHGAQEGSLTDIPFVADVDTASAVLSVGRQLTDSEISTLANNIVTQIINRGRPFASLAEFAASNVITAAILGSGINPTDLELGGTDEEYRGTAGMLTSGDVIAAIAPFMSARSDTFKIRAYGDVRNPITSQIEGRAWCEAVLQRVPDLVYSSSSPTPAILDAAEVAVANPADYPFGRKFQIVSFRWLTPADL